MNFIKTFAAALLAFIVGSFVTFFLWIMLLIGVASIFSSDKVVVVHPGSILKIDLAESIVDSPVADPFANFDLLSMRVSREMSLMRVLRAIEAAKNDPRIDGIYLRPIGGGGMDSAIAEELRESIDDFRQSGKFVVAYNETYSQGLYYLATAADAVYIHPEGAMDWSGLSMNMMFFKGLLDKLDLKADVFRPDACTYKSAVEPFTLTRMSDANREQMQAIVSSFWNTIAGTVAEARGIELSELNRMADNLEVTLSDEAFERGLVDGMLYEDQMNDVFDELGAASDSKGEYTFISLSDYALQVTTDPGRISSPQMAVVYADGDIVDGMGSGRSIYGNSLAQTLAEVRKNDKYKAVVLRVNSPGGSALASDIVWREMTLLRAEKPVVVSMGSYAASGGYYISCPADAIIADRLTLTGSIGVFGIYFNTIDALKNKLGITYDAVKSNTSAGMGIAAPLTAAERASIMRGTNRVYDTFTKNVAEGRNLSIEQVLGIAGGRVWSGEDALKIGLVDACGGLTTAIALAADKAELGGDYRVVEVVKHPTGLSAVLSSLGEEIRGSVTGSELGTMMKQYEQVQAITRQQGIVMYFPYRMEFR